MKDVQNSRDNRKIALQKAGIRNLRHPIVVLDRRKGTQPTTAYVSMYVDLPHNFKGTHMSRFVEILRERHGRIFLSEIDDVLRAMTKRFNSRTAHVEIRFPYFIEKRAPVSRSRSLMSYDCAFVASMTRRGKRESLDLVVETSVPVTLLCPCSKEISERGAHNQRSIITMRVRSKGLVWIEELVQIAESVASSPVYSLLKREDEKYVTEHAFDNPLFAEDAVRAVAQKLRADRRILWYEVESENLESIHNHSAYAMVGGRCDNSRRNKRMRSSA